MILQMKEFRNKILKKSYSNRRLDYLSYSNKKFCYPNLKEAKNKLKLKNNIKTLIDFINDAKYQENYTNEIIHIVSNKIFRINFRIAFLQTFPSQIRILLRLSICC